MSVHTLAVGGPRCKLHMARSRTTKEGGTLCVLIIPVHEIYVKTLAQRITRTVALGMCLSVPVLARKSVERVTFTHICLTNDFGDRTRMSEIVFRFLLCR